MFSCQGGLTSRKRQTRREAGTQSHGFVMADSQTAGILSSWLFGCFLYKGGGSRRIENEVMPFCSPAIKCSQFHFKISRGEI
jgi:hypothetical protein